MNQQQNELGLEGQLLSATCVSSLCSLEKFAANDEIVELQIPLIIENWEMGTPQIKTDEERPIEIVVQRGSDTTITPPPQALQRRNGRGRKQNLISRPEFAGISKQRRRPVKSGKMYDKDPNEPNIDGDERSRRLKAKKDRNYRLKQNSDLKCAKMEVVLLRVAEEEHVKEISGLKGKLRAMEEQVWKLKAELAKEKQKIEKMEELARLENDLLLYRLFDEVDLNFSSSPLRE